jgi:hypothetical protein
VTEILCDVLPVLPALQSVDRSGLSVSWGVPFVVAAVAMVGAGVVIGFKTIKGMSAIACPPNACAVTSNVIPCLRSYHTLMPVWRHRMLPHWPPYEMSSHSELTAAAIIGQSVHRRVTTRLLCVACVARREL